jgi:hypothetical protein
MRWIVAAVLCLPAACLAGESCPWLNAATAGGVLGGAVQATVTHPGKNADDAACDFVRQEGPAGGRLYIEVHTMHEPRREFASYAAQCPANPVPLRAIGNEAVACGRDGKHGEIAEQVVGRVRDRAFLVRVSADVPPAQRGALREQARKVAEQVAGALF